MHQLEIFNTIPDQYNYYFDIKLPDLSSLKDINKAIVCGVGSSAFPASIIQDHIKKLYKRDILFICNDNELPQWIDKNTLVIIASFSGSTTEPVSCLKAAIEKKYPLIGISMGGEISRICGIQKIPYISLPKVNLPKYHSGIMVSAILRVLNEVNLVPKQDEEIQNIKIILDPLMVNIRKSAESLAKKIKERIITIYSESKDVVSADIAKLCLNETGKTLAFSQVLPESTYNEISAYEFSTFPHGIILLTGPQINKKTLQKFELLQTLMVEKNIIFERINCNFEKGLYRNIYFTIYFSYLSYFIAIESEYNLYHESYSDKLRLLLKSSI